ncbi:MAG TPA: amidohydrolase family protein [Bryobacteraceae bacterium]|nr:amidohydrolase family protein [Bryobacteraceae bacterium]
MLQMRSFYLGIALLPVLLAQQPAERAPVTMAIVGGQVVDGTGAGPITDGVVLIAGNRIAAVGHAGAVAIPKGVKVVQAGGMTVMPGLIDMHVHLCLIGHADEDHFVRIYADREEREIIPASARQYLMNGITTVRDTGGPIEIVKVRDRINRGELVGARMFVCGPLLQRHPNDTLKGWSWTVMGAEDGRQKVQQLVAAGVDWIKVHDQSSYSDEELTAITQEAAKAHKPVAGHGYSSDAEVLRAIKYHFKTLEHPGLGDLLDYSPEVIHKVIDTDTCIDPTSTRRTIFEDAEKFPSRLHDPIAAEYLPPDLYAGLETSLADYLHLPNADHERRWSKNLAQKVEPFVKAGACIVAGTDSGEPELIHGASTWYELRNFVRFGMTPLEAITAATSRPGHLLAPDVGALLPGYHADVILVKGDVLADINLLQNPAHVIKDGVQYK